MFNKNIAYYGLSGYIIGLGYSMFVESITENKWDKHYKQLLKDGTPAPPVGPPCCIRSYRPSLIPYILPLPSLIGIGIGMYKGYYKN